MSPDPVTVHGMSTSGNCHKVRLLLEQLGRSYAWIEVDSANGGTRTPEYLARNPNGKVPMLERADGGILVESNAILCWLAEGTSFLPDDAWQRAQALSWLFFEQYSHEPYIAVARNIRAYQGTAAQNAERLARCDENGGRALDAMEHRLGAHDWLTDAGPTVADLALFAYTHVADEGGFDLARWPGVSAWVKRLAALPGIVTLPRR
jgi:glutathione S-transferase